MPLSAILIGLVILFIIATVPVWPYSRAWGFLPSGVLGLLLVVLLGLLGRGVGDPALVGHGPEGLHDVSGLGAAGPRRLEVARRDGQRRSNAVVAQHAPDVRQDWMPGIDHVQRDIRALGAQLAVGALRLASAVIAARPSAEPT